MADNASPEKVKLSEHGGKSPDYLVVRQPPEVADLFKTLDTISKIAESVSQDRSGDLTAGSASAAQTGKNPSAREQAIADLPEEPVMREQLALHIENEIRTLRKQVSKSTKRISRPGNAHKLNELYARIRRLNALLSNLIKASYEVIRRLAIRVFVDKQPIL